MDQKGSVAKAIRGIKSHYERNLTKRQKLVIGALIAILFVGSILWINRINNNSGNARAVAENKQDYQDMKNNEKPASDSTASKAEYYQLLASKANKAGDYRGAIDAFENRAKVLGDTMPAQEYTELTTYYCRIEDSKGALGALNTGLQLKQASNDEKSRLAASIKLIEEKDCTAWIQLFDQL